MNWKSYIYNIDTYLTRRVRLLFALFYTISFIVSIFLNIDFISIILYVGIVELSVIAIIAFLETKREINASITLDAARSVTKLFHKKEFADVRENDSSY